MLPILLVHGQGISPTAESRRDGGGGGGVRGKVGGGGGGNGALTGLINDATHSLECLAVSKEHSAHLLLL